MTESSTESALKRGYSFAMQEEDYFAASNDRRDTEKLIDRSRGFVRFKNEHTCQFSYYYFIEFFFYHVLFFLVLGPFTFILGPIINMTSASKYGIRRFERTNVFSGSDLVNFCVSTIGDHNRARLEQKQHDKSCGFIYSNDAYFASHCKYFLKIRYFHAGKSLLH